MDAEDAPPPPDLPDWCFEEEVKKGPYYNLFTVSHLFLNRQALMTMESQLWRQTELVGAMALGGKGGMGVEKDLEGGRGESSWRGCQEFPISPYRWEMCWKHCWLDIFEDGFFISSQSSQRSRGRFKEQLDGAKVFLGLNRFPWTGKILASLQRNPTWCLGRQMAQGFVLAPYAV